MTAPEPTTIPASPGSAYPPDIESLKEPATTLMHRLGELPSRNRLMAELKIGAPKATAVREWLAAGHPDAPISPGMPAIGPFPPVTLNGHPAPKPLRKKPSAWPLMLLALPAYVAIWSGWVGIGELTGFGVVHPLPGIADWVRLNTAITLPISFEAYATYAFRVWLSPAVSKRTRRFSGWSVVISAALGMLGQIAYHLMVAAGMKAAPWQITTAVACVPVVVALFGFGLAHLVHTDEPEAVTAS